MKIGIGARAAIQGAVNATIAAQNARKKNEEEMSNDVIKEINAVHEKMNKNPEYRKEQLKVSYTLLKDRVYRLFEEKKAIKHEIEKLLNKAEAEDDMKDLVNDIILLESSMHN